MTEKDANHLPPINKRFQFNPEERRNYASASYLKQKEGEK